MVIPMLLRPANSADIPAVVALERLPTAPEFVGQWSEERHRATLAGGDARYYVSETNRVRCRATPFCADSRKLRAPSN